MALADGRWYLLVFVVELIVFVAEYLLVFLVELIVFGRRQNICYTSSPLDRWKGSNCKKKNWKRKLEKDKKDNLIQYQGQIEAISKT